MTAAATAATLLVIYASAASLLVFLPYWLAVQAHPRAAAGCRADLWRDALMLPLAVAVAGAAYGLLRQWHLPLFSPHAEYVRPHLCLRPLLEAPDAHWRAAVFSGLCLFLVLAAVVSLVVRLWRGSRESARLRRAGTPLETPAQNPGVLNLETDAVALASHRGPGPLVVVSPRLGQLFPPRQAETILAHEICHARRRDGLWQTLTQSAVLIAGLSPLSYLAYREWKHERELACDLEATQATSLPDTEAALARARELAGALEEVSPLSPPPLDSLQELTGRRERLHQAAAASLAPAKGYAVAGLTLLLLGLALGVVFRRPLADTLQCMAESFLRALG